MPEIPSTLYAQPQIAPPKIVMIARFCEQKDHLSLILALNKISHLNWELDLIGDGDSQLIAAKIEELKLSHKVNILGYRSNVNEILSASQIFVLISHWEGLPLSIIEAMRAGLPIIASDVGGVSEVIINTQTGYLVKSIEDISYRLQQLIINPALRTTLGVQAQKYYKKNLSLKNQLDKTFMVYNEMINGNKSTTT